MLNIPWKYAYRARVLTHPLKYVVWRHLVTVTRLTTFTSLRVLHCMMSPRHWWCMTWCLQNPQWGKSRQSRHTDDFDEINGRHTTYYKRCVSTCPICIRAAYLLGPPLVLSLRLPAQPAWNWCHQWHIYTLSIYIYTVVDSSLSISQPITTKNWHDSLLCCLNLTKKK